MPHPLNRACSVWLVLGCVLALWGCDPAPERPAPARSASLLMYRTVARDSTWLDAELGGLVRVTPPLSSEETLEAHVWNAKGHGTKLSLNRKASDGERSLFAINPASWPDDGVGQRFRLQLRIRQHARSTPVDGSWTIRWGQTPKAVLERFAGQVGSVTTFLSDAAPTGVSDVAWLWLSRKEADDADKGGLSAAVEAYRGAAKVAHKLGVSALAAECLRKASLRALKLGDYVLALRLLQEAKAETDGVTDPKGEVDQAYQEALLALRLGRLAHAKQRAEAALAGASRSERTTLRCVSLEMLGELLQVQRRYPQALEAYDKALDCQKTHAQLDPEGLATVEINQAWTLLRAAADGLEPQFARADRLLEHAASIAKVPSSRANALANLAWSRFQQGEFERALETLRSALQASPDDEGEIGRFVPLLEGWVHVSQGDARRAARAFQSVLKESERTPGFVGLLSAQAHFGLARTFRSQPDGAERALDHLRRAVDQALRAGTYGDLFDPEAFLFAAPAQLADELLLVLAERGLVEEALRTLGRLQEQSWRAWRRAAREPSGELADAQLMAKLRSEHAAAQRAWRELDKGGWQVVPTEAGRYAQELERAREREREALEQILQAATAWVPEGPSVLEVPGGGPQPRALVRSAGDADDSVQATAAGEPPLPLQHDEALLIVRALGERWLSLLSLPAQAPRVATVAAPTDLLAPWADALQDVRHVFVSSGGDARAQRLPFAAMLPGEAPATDAAAQEGAGDAQAVDSDGVPWLSRFSFSFLPHPALLLELRGWPASLKTTVFANPDGSLQHAATEGWRIRGRRPDAALVMGKDVNAAGFAAALRNPGIVHFAGHVVQTDGDPWSTRLQFSDGDVAIADVGLARAQVDLVVLSGCESARAIRVRPQQWFSLSEVLLSSGAQRVIASRHPLGDASALALVDDFYAQLEKQRPAEALRHATLTARARGNPNWASLVLFGAR